MPGHEPPVFYYDLNSPYAWLAAERVNSLLPVVPVWQPISFGFVLRHTGRTPWSLRPETVEQGKREVERRARERGLLEVRWPEGWPLGTYSLPAMRAATFAGEIGRAVAFSLAAYRQQFNGGRGLDEFDNVLIAAAACELHPNAMLQAVERQAIKDRLRKATEDAIARGVTGVPTVRVGDELFWGDDRLEDAAAALAA
ncbi:MAG TPA: DsbA family protein [Thermoleophilaceae bacterium]|nr:DsbA family protein [Thermoleophilaceae bacterium]